MRKLILGKNRFKINKNCDLYKYTTKPYINKLGNDLFVVYDIIICDICGIHISSQFDDDVTLDKYKKELEYNLDCFIEYAKNYGFFNLIYNGDEEHFIMFSREWFRKQKLEKIISKMKRTIQKNTLSFSTSKSMKYLRTPI